MSPGLLFEVKLVTPQLSLATGAGQVADWSQVARPGPVFTTMFPGQPVITGAVVSFTMSDVVHVLVLLAASLTVITIH